MKEKYLKYLKEKELTELVKSYENKEISFEELEQKVMFDFDEISLRVYIKREKMNRITD